MRREHFLVAELYRHLATFVDAERAIYLSLDGEAAKRGVREKLFKDPDVPDLCFTLLDGREVAIEAKILYGGQIGARRGQYESWFANGIGAHKPTGWVIADEPLKSFFYCSHAEMLKQRIVPPGPDKRRSVNVPVPTTMPMFRSIRHLALHILMVTP